VFSRFTGQAAAGRRRQTGLTSPDAGTRGPVEHARTPSRTNRQPHHREADATAPAGAGQAGWAGAGGESDGSRRVLVEEGVAHQGDEALLQAGRRDIPSEKADKQERKHCIQIPTPEAMRDN
jgi:hypothetical protein